MHKILKSNHRSFWFTWISLQHLPTEKAWIMSNNEKPDIAATQHYWWGWSALNTADAICGYIFLQAGFHKCFIACMNYSVVFFFNIVSILLKKAEPVCKCASRCLVQDSEVCVWSQVTVQVAKLHQEQIHQEDGDTEPAPVGRNRDVEANEAQYSQARAHLLKEHPAAKNTTTLQPRRPGITGEVWNRCVMLHQLSDIQIVMFSKVIFECWTGEPSSRKWLFTLCRISRPTPPHVS